MKSIIELLEPTPNKVWFAVSHEIDADFFSKATEYFQKTNYSHALSIYWSQDSEDFVFNASHGVGVQLDLAHQVLGIDKIIRLWECDINEVQRAAYIRKTFELNGVEYSERQILGIAMAKVMNLVKSPFQNAESAMICSEYADTLTIAVGLDSASYSVGKGKDLLNPQDNVFHWDSLTQDLSEHKDRFRELAVYGQ